RGDTNTSGHDGEGESKGNEPSFHDPMVSLGGRASLPSPQLLRTIRPTRPELPVARAGRWPGTRPVSLGRGDHGAPERYRAVSRCPVSPSNPRENTLRAGS